MLCDGLVYSWLEMEMEFVFCWISTMGIPLWKNDFPQNLFYTTDKSVKIADHLVRNRCQVSSDISLTRLKTRNVAVLLNFLSQHFVAQMDVSSSWVIWIICNCVKRSQKIPEEISEHIISYLLSRLLELSFIRNGIFKERSFYF